MDGDTPENKSSSGHKRLSVSFLVSLMVLCAKHANRLSKKLKLKPKKRTHVEDSGAGERFRWNLNTSTMKSPRPKELFTALSNKAMTMIRRRNTGYDGGVKAEEKKNTEEEHGVWQREILMGGKCEPLDFAGVIYYDCNGRQLRELPPRSPRGTPLPPRSPRGTPLPPRSPRGTLMPNYPTRS